MKIQVKQGHAASTATHVLVIAGYEGDSVIAKPLQPLNRALGGHLAELRKTGEFQGKSNQVVLVHTRKALPAKRLLWVGLGKRGSVTLDRVRQAMGTVAKRVRQTGGILVYNHAPGSGPLRLVAGYSCSSDGRRRHLR